MHLLYITPGYKPAFNLGGPILSVASAAEEIVKRGHRVTVFTTNRNLDSDLDVPVNQPIIVDGIEVWYFTHKETIRTISLFKYFSKSIGYLYSPAMAKELKRFVGQVDLINTQLPFNYPTKIGAHCATRAGKPLFYHQRGVLDPNALSYRSFRKKLYISLIERPIMNKATTLIALTEAEKTNYKALGVETHCEIVPNGIDVQKYRRYPSKDFLLKYALDPGKLVILFLARLHHTKGADLLLDAFIGIANKFPNALLVIAGPDESGIRGDYERKVSEAGLARRVVFPGQVSGETKLNFLARADLFCKPSIVEGFSMAVLEAMASATSLMLSPECNFPEIESAESGIIVPRDIDSWIKGLSLQLSDPQRLATQGKNAYNLVRDKYTWSQVAERLEEVYKEGIARKTRKKSWATIVN